jgi:hypothetical protein
MSTAGNATRIGAAVLLASNVKTPVPHVARVTTRGSSSTPTARGPSVAHFPGPSTQRARDDRRRNKESARGTFRETTPAVLASGRLLAVLDGSPGMSTAELGNATKGKRDQVLVALRERETAEHLRAEAKARHVGT